MKNWLVKLKHHPIYKLWNMKELSLNDQEIYHQYIKETKYEVSVWASNFAYLWAHTRSNHLKILRGFVDDHLVTFILTRRGRLYLPCLPFGNGNVEEIVNVLIKCAKVCLGWNQYTGYVHKSIVNPINQVQLDFLQSSPRYKRYFKEERLSGLERHYSIPKLVELKGKDFSKVRNKINKFNRIYKNAIVRQYQPSDFDAIMKLGEKWEETSGQNYHRILDGFYFEPIMKHYKELNQIIIVVEVDKKIIGMTTGEILPTGQAWGCLKKINKEYTGISEFLTVEIAKVIHRINPEVETINVGSDLGKKGLTFFKERFRPVLNYERYAIFFKR